ncbi:MAG: DUF342 domain-containing protein [Velocimicrobium sp.]
MAMNMETTRVLVRVSDDLVQAYLSLYPVDKDEVYAVSDLESILEDNNIVVGIKIETLRSIVSNKLYYTEQLVAQGIAPEQGRDGEFEFMFSIEQDTKPKILPDGSVDYGNMQDVSVIEAGQELVRYKPAVVGANGVDVYGKPIVAKIGRELPVLKGKGFKVSDDKRLYTAMITGKVEFKNDRLTVSNMIKIDGDVTILTGNIHFSGDVLVTGNVVSGMTIHAKGNITVNGHVEGAQLIADRDVILKNGMQGAGRGEIRAGGHVCAKFFEQTTIYAKGSVKANAILNCNIMSEQEIIVSGKKGIIVGGSLSAIRKIEATMVGNMSEVKTRIDLGVDKEIYEHIRKVKNKYKYVLDEIARIEDGVLKINSILEKADNQELAEKKLSLIRAKIAKDSVVASVLKEIENLRTNVENSIGSTLVVHKSIYRGAKITINGCVKLIESENYNVTYFSKNGEIGSRQNI